MHIESLRLQDFRSYHQLKLAPAAGTTVFVGENGAGKTNLLEAVHLCCLGRSHRTANDREMIRAGAETGAVQVRVRRGDGVDTVGVRLFGGAEKRRKILHINGKNAARTGELMGHVTCVMFSPEDIELMRGAPLGRGGRHLIIGAEIMQAQGLDMRWKWLLCSGMRRVTALL